jgi:hypothetical protein
MSDLTHGTLLEQHAKALSAGAKAMLVDHAQAYAGIVTTRDDAAGRHGRPLERLLAKDVQARSRHTLDKRLARIRRGEEEHDIKAGLGEKSTEIVGDGKTVSSCELLTPCDTGAPGTLHLDSTLDLQLHKARGVRAYRHAEPHDRQTYGSIRHRPCPLRETCLPPASGTGGLIRL